MFDNLWLTTLTALCPLRDTDASDQWHVLDLHMCLTPNKQLRIWGCSAAGW